MAAQKQLSPELQSAVDRKINAALKKSIETKCTRYNGASGIDLNGSIVSLTRNLTRGDSSVDEATGTLIKPQWLTLKTTWSTDQNFSTCRVLIFQWKDSSLPVPSGILDLATTPFAPISYISWVNHRKIRVLADKVIAMKPRASGGYDAKVKVFSLPLSTLPPIQLPLNGLGVVPQMNGLFVLLISDDAVASFPICDITSELTFTDA